MKPLEPCSQFTQSYTSSVKIDILQQPKSNLRLPSSLTTINVSDISADTLQRMTRVVELESYEKDSNLRAVDLGKAEMKDERERCDGIWLTIGGVLITALGVLLLLGGLGIFGPVSSLALGWILGLSAGVLIGAGSLSVIVGPLLIAQTNSEFNHEKKCLRKQKKDEERIRQSHRMYLEEDITALQRAFKEINPQTVPMDYLIISEMCKNFAEKLGKRELVDFYEGFSMSLAEQQIPTPVSPSQ